MRQAIIRRFIALQKATPWWTSNLTQRRAHRTGLIGGNPRHRFRRNHCHRRRRADHLLEFWSDPDIWLYQIGGCRKLPRLDHSGSSQSAPLGGIELVVSNRRKPLPPTRLFLSVPGLTKYWHAYFCRIHDRLAAPPGKRVVGNELSLRDATKRFEKIREMQASVRKSSCSDVEPIVNTGTSPSERKCEMTELPRLEFSVRCFSVRFRLRNR